MSDTGYAQQVVAHFLARRQKASAESSRDQVQIERWEREGIPLGAVLDGIDRAFAALREPPTSVSRCGRWVRGVVREVSQSQPGSLVDQPGSPASGPLGDQPGSLVDQPGSPVRLADSLRQFATAAPPPVAGACVELADEIEQIERDEGGITLDVLRALPEAFADLVLDRLPPAAAAAARARADALDAEARVRALFAFLTARFDVPAFLLPRREG